MTTTNLSNSNLLDEGLANSKSLKSQRLNQTAERAVNPTPKPKIEEKKYNVESERNTEEFEFPANKPDFAFNKNNAERTSLKNDESKKILGMNPALFYTVLLGVGAAVGGYFLYKYIKNKKIGEVVKSVPTEVPELPPIQ
jgi:hypothetical protein